MIKNYSVSKQMFEELLKDLLDGSVTLTAKVVNGKVYDVSLTRVGEDAPAVKVTFDEVEFSVDQFLALIGDGAEKVGRDMGHLKSNREEDYEYLGKQG